jgi:hypothetical protein|tara:strand:- start:2291 stop:2716 length:426 start_codon:yes stop_codon:yes gene_type:complete
MTKYIIKFDDQTHLTKPDAELYGNFLSDHKYSQFDRSMAQQFSCELSAILVSKIVGGKVVTLDTNERYKLGKTYFTIGGQEAEVVGVHEERKGYETVVVQLSNGRQGGRYNRTNGGWDNGRTTGSKWTKDCLRYPPEEVYK